MKITRISKYKLGIFIASFFVCFFGILPILHAQCDFTTTTPVIINQTGTPYSGGTTIYCLVNNATGNVVATAASAPANFGVQTKGAYTAYAINYVGASPTGISVGAAFNPGGTCLSTTKHLITVCNEIPALSVCEGEDLQVVSNPDFADNAKMVYALVYNADGKIKAFSDDAPSATFPTSGLPTGGYTVYVVNYTSPSTSAAANIGIGNDWNTQGFAPGCHTVASAPANIYVIPSTPTVQQTTYCNGTVKLEVPTASIPSGQVVEWYNNNTHTGTANANPYIVSSAGTYYAFLRTIGSDCYGIPASISVSPVSMSNTIPATDGTARYANYECVDASGWTHYGFDPDGPNTGLTAYVPNNDGDELLLFSIKKNGLTIGTVGDGTFKVLIDGLAGAPAASGASHIPQLYPTNYCQATNWYVMNRYWNVTPNGTGAGGQITGDVDIRFYFTQDDTMAIVANVPNIGGVGNLYFYKINGNYPINPNPGSNHGAIPLAAAYNANGYQQYSYGASSTTSTWSWGNMSIDRFFAEYKVGSFSGGGGGASSFFGALPVELLSFTGTTDNAFNYLKWETAKEMNFSHFDVMRSGENTIYTKLDKVFSKGVNGGGAIYNYVDKQPFSGINYYQLHLYDKDGEMNPSNIVELMISPSFSFGLFPNPAKEEVFLTINGAETSIGFALYNVIGQEVANYEWTENMNGLHTINVSSLASGTYFYKMKDGEKTYKGKFVKE